MSSRGQAGEARRARTRGWEGVSLPSFPGRACGLRPDWKPGGGWMPGPAKVSWSWPGLSPPACHSWHPHALCCTAATVLRFTACSLRQRLKRHVHLAQREAPAPSCGGAEGRQCSQLPSDFQKDSATPFVSSGLCLWEPGAPVMSTRSHYLFHVLLYCVHSWQAL